MTVAYGSLTIWSALALLLLASAVVLLLGLLAWFESKHDSDFTEDHSNRPRVGRK